MQETLPPPARRGHHEALRRETPPGAQPGAPPRPRETLPSSPKPHQPALDSPPRGGGGPSTSSGGEREARMAVARRKRSDPRPWTGRGERSRERRHGTHTIRGRLQRAVVATTLNAARSHREPNTELHNVPLADPSPAVVATTPIQHPRASPTPQGRDCIDTIRSFSPRPTPPSPAPPSPPAPPTAP